MELSLPSFLRFPLFCLVPPSMESDTPPIRQTPPPNTNAKPCDDSQSKKLVESSSSSASAVGDSSGGCCKAATPPKSSVCFKDELIDDDDDNDDDDDEDNNDRPPRFSRCAKSSFSTSPCCCCSSVRARTRARVLSCAAVARLAKSMMLLMCGTVRCDANSVGCSALRESGDRRRGGQERFEQMDLMTFEIMRS